MKTKADIGRELRDQLVKVLHDHADTSVPVKFAMEILEAINEYDNQIIVIEEIEKIEEPAIRPARFEAAGG